MDELIGKRIVVITLDGYSASTRKVKLKDIVNESISKINKKYTITDQYHLYVRYESARLARSKKRKTIKYLQKYNNDDHILFLIGKSYGGKVTERILNSVKLNYHKTFVLTIDPCWPKFFDWSPNCNEDNLFIKNMNVDEIYNIYLVADRRKQCGCPVYSMYKKTRVLNKALPGYKHENITHNNIIDNVFVRYLVYEYLKRCFYLGNKLIKKPKLLYPYRNVLKLDMEKG